MVNLFTDYEYRNKALSYFDILEFEYLMLMRPLSSDEQQEAQDHAENIIDDDDLLNIYFGNKDDENESDDDNDNVNETITEPKPSKLKPGMKEGTIIHFHRDHHQHVYVHQAYAVTSMKIPIITGKYLSIYPKKSSVRNPKYRGKLEDFESYLMSMEYS
jgi:hypothetical protein